MAIQQLKRQSDLEKRLNILRKQVYGKNPQEERNNQNIKPANTPFPQSGVSILSDTAYLRQDLLKIVTMATFTIGAQIILFYLIQLHILKINFF